MLHKTRGIVLHHVKYGDSSIVTTIYTELLGRKSFLVQGVYGKRTKFHPSFFQPFTLLDLQIDQKLNRDLQHIRELSIIQPFQSIPFDTSKRTITLFLAEILSKTIREEEANPALFQFLIHSIQLLDVTETGIANFHLLFLIHLSKYLGFYPTDNFSEKVCQFDFVNGKFCLPGLNPDKLALEVSYLVHKLMNVSFQHLDTFSVNHEKRLVLLRSLIEYYSFHLGGIGEVKSLPVLQSVFEED